MQECEQENFVYSVIVHDKVWMVLEKIQKNVKLVKMEIAQLSILLLLLSLKSGFGKEVCPKICTCDVFEGYKRADCR